VRDRSAVTTFLFSDIEGSTRLWEQEPERMSLALAGHDGLARAVVESHHGTVVKTTGDGMYAAFDDPVDALRAAVVLQQSIADPAATAGVELRLRCGLHAGVVEQRDNDYFGRAVNRASRIMTAAHGGQVLLSQEVATLVGERLPDNVTLRDLGGVRLRDLARHGHLFQVLHPQLRADFPALRTLEATPNNLPQQITSFIGREHELAEARELLRKTRLLTLTGAGGLGKTRLSLQLAAEAIDDYPDGVWFVELAPLADGDRVPQALADVLGVKEDAGRPVEEALVKHVGDRTLLVILDNCEHLTDTCAKLAVRLLKAAPRVKILASSREHLHVAGEVIFQVPSLAVPAPDPKITLAAVTQYEAVRLFVDRAVAANPTFAVTEHNAWAVTEICRRLDGIPLALELAAARVRSLSAEKIAERLCDRFRLLTTGDRAALARQQTLRASIDWSFDLLPAPERALLCRLAVFAGGWTLEGAEAVASGDGIEEANVLDMLSRLVEKSLVELDADRQRYRLLETVRQYAQEKLNEGGDEFETRSRHLDYYLSFAEKARQELVGRDHASWLVHLDDERENLLSAHGWCNRAEAGGELGLRLVKAIKQYLVNRGLWALLHAMTVEALARTGARGRSAGRCAGLFNAGQACCFMGRYGEASIYLEESVAIARELGDRGRIGSAVQLLGLAALAQGDLATARRHLEEGLALARETGDKYELAAATNGLAQLCRVEGALDAAEPLYETVLALAHELGDREVVAVALLNLAMVAVARGSASRANAMLLDVHAIVEEIGSKPAGQSVLEVSAGLASLREEWVRAARYFGAAETQAVQTGLRRDPADEAFLSAMVGRARAALAAQPFATAESEGRALPYGAALADARAWLQANAPD
jgi:predicted ATPase/class 3 adenylate cyclase